MSPELVPDVEEIDLRHRLLRVNGLRRGLRRADMRREQNEIDCEREWNKPSAADGVRPEHTCMMHPAGIGFTRIERYARPASVLVLPQEQGSRERAKCSFEPSARGIALARRRLRSRRIMAG